MKKQCSEFDTGLPTPREFLYRPVEVIPLEFKLPSYFTTLPVWLVTITNKKIECRLFWLKWIVLSEISESQSRVMNHFPSIEFFFTQDYFEKGAFPCTISTDESYFSVVGNCG